MGVLFRAPKLSCSLVYQQPIGGGFRAPPAALPGGRTLKNVSITASFISFE
jgi:hypothetical protein